MDRRTRRLRRSRARRRQLTALGVIALCAFLLGVAVAWAGSGRDSGKDVSGGTSGQTAASGAGDAASTGPAQPVTARVVSGGDVMPDRSVEEYANANGPDAVLEDIAPVLKLVREYSAALDTSIRIDGDIGYVRAGKK